MDVENKPTINKARCKSCGTIVESKHRHDWVKCFCFNPRNASSRGFFLDGGKDYIRFGGNFSDIDWLHE